MGVEAKQLHRHSIEARQERRNVGNENAELAPLARGENRRRRDFVERKAGYPQHEARRLLMVLGELGDAFELGNAVGNDQHVLADREVDEIVVLGVAVYVEFFRRNACLERAARFVRRGDIDPDARLGGKTKDRWVRPCLAGVTDLAPGIEPLEYIFVGEKICLDIGRVGDVKREAESLDPPGERSSPEDELVAGYIDECRRIRGVGKGVRTRCTRSKRSHSERNDGLTKKIPS